MPEGAAFVVTTDDVRKLIGGVIDLAIEMLPGELVKLFGSGLYQLMDGDPADVFRDEYGLNNGGAA